MPTGARSSASTRIRSGADEVQDTVASVAARLAGKYQLGTFQSLTLLDAGTAGMVLACLAYVAVLAERQR